MILIVTSGLVCAIILALGLWAWSPIFRDPMRRKS